MVHNWKSIINVLALTTDINDVKETLYVYIYIY